ncbi:MAG: MFS transporter [Pseudolabrys sp.]|nr:MFS transporter [Pseudolabrys sp.]
MNEVKTKDVERPQSPAPGRWPAEPDFWRLWLIGAVQFSVRWIEMLAVAVAVYQTTGSAFLVTVMSMLRVLPMALFGAFIGAAADRFPGHTIMVVTTSVQFATSVAVAVLAYAGQLETWHLAISIFINGTIWAGDNAVRRLMMSRVVGANRMANAMTFDIGASNVSRMAGPAIGGTIFAIWGIGACFVLGAVLYLASVIAAITLRYRQQPVQHGGSFILHDILDALRLIKRNNDLIGILSVTIIFNMFAWPLLSLVPVIGQDDLQLGPSGVGILASMEGVGAIFGVLLSFAFAKQKHEATLYTYSIPVYIVALMAFALMPNPVLAGIALTVAGIGGSGFMINQSAILFRSVKLEMRARMLGLLTVMIGTGPLGFLQVGWLAEAIGTKNAIMTIGIQGLIATLLTRRYWGAIK